MIYAFDGHAPQIDPTAWVAPTAVLIGRVILRPGASVWFGSVLRGDNEPIEVGENSNIQENCVLHTDMGYPLTIGREVTVGHKAMLHGCTLEDGCLVGMGATVLNGAVIGSGALVGACALVTEGKRIEPGALVMGAPGKVVRMLDGAAQARQRSTATHYVENAARYRAGLREV
ncbi:MAG TPA: gamma carbonic anhydrase family protein [Paracoccaceae bacterium]|nr:gamma carbonic anhydrase family protein [Paracoccaceae bacterium]HMO70701.1 gamma carbonic anhydrase family protein [Paracoccaceae bacterium]